MNKSERLVSYRPKQTKSFRLTKQNQSNKILKNRNCEFKCRDFLSDFAEISQSLFFYLKLFKSLCLADWYLFLIHYEKVLFHQKVNKI